MNIGVIGCGAIVQAVHLNVLHGMNGVKIIALAEPDEQRRTQASARIPEAKAYADWRQLLANQSVEAVIIALPTGMHALAAEAALDAGKHVYLEKPLAISVEEARRVVQVRQERNRVGMIGFNYRFNPLYEEIRRLVQARKVGPTVCVRTVFSTCATNLPEWKKLRASGGGVLLDLGSHHFDLLRFMFGQAEQVSARIESVASDGDTATVSIRFADGIISESFFSLASVEEDRIEVYGRDGKVWADRYRSAAVQVESARRSLDFPKRAAQAVAGLGAMMRKIARRGNELSYAAALGAFVNAIQTGGAVSPDFTDGLRSLQIVEAAEESAKRGVVVRM